VPPRFQQIDCKLPLLNYFVSVGGALLALLLLADAALPRAPDHFAADVQLPNIRIHSDRKTPEKIVLSPETGAGVVATSAAATVDSHDTLSRESFALLLQSPLNKAHLSRGKQSQTKTRETLASADGNFSSTKQPLRPYRRPLAEADRQDEHQHDLRTRENTLRRSRIENVR